MSKLELYREFRNYLPPIETVEIKKVEEKEIKVEQPYKTEVKKEETEQEKPLQKQKSNLHDVADRIDNFMKKTNKIAVEVFKMIDLDGSSRLTRKVN